MNVFYEMVQLRYVILLLLIQCCMIVFGEEGDSCFSLIGGQGTCKYLHQCPYAINLLVQGIYPEICGFIGFDCLVCCKEDNIGVAPELIDIQQNRISGAETLIDRQQNRGPGATRPTDIQRNRRPGSARPTDRQRNRIPGELSRKKCEEYHPNIFPVILVPGGVPSAAREFPHMAAIGYGEGDIIEWLCGGSLISINFVLTAAHCLNEGSPNPARWVRLGELDFATDQDDARPQNYAIKTRIPHPGYRTPPRYNDIGLIELDRGVTLSQYVGIACLDTVRQHNEKQMIATGWGNIQFAAAPSTALLKIYLDVKSSAECQRFYGLRAELPNGVIDDRQICAGGGRQQDTCQGDSGGPLQLRSDIARGPSIVYNIIGVTSFGKACGLTRSPGIYTRVYSYLSWIESIVWPSE